MRASRWGGRFGCLEVTYEESKPRPGVLRQPLQRPGLEVTYEESKPHVQPHEAQVVYEFGSYL